MKSPFRPRPAATQPHRPTPSYPATTPLHYPHPAAIPPHRPTPSPITAIVTARVFAPFTTLAILALLATLGGCKKNSDPQPAGSVEPEVPVLFRASIGDLVPTSSETRTAQTGDVGTDWVVGDAVGVFMIPHGGTLADATGRNAAYVHTLGGNFAAHEGDELLYPRIGSVDFVAYYPWREIAAGHLLSVDVGGRCDPAAMDLLYSDNAVECTSGETPVLRFSHRLAKLAFDVTDATGASLKGVGATITGPATRGTFDLATGLLAVDDGSSGEIVAAWRDDGDGIDATARLEAIVVPCVASATTVDFALADGSTARLVLPASEWLAGSVYTYRVRITGGGKVVLDGESAIVDWDDRGSSATEYSIEKQTPGDDDPDNPGDPDPSNLDSPDNHPGDPDNHDDPDDGDDDPTDPVKPTEPDKVEVYFKEGFGTYAGSEGVAIADYKGWDNAAVSFSDAFRDMFGTDGARVSYSKTLGTHIEFPPGVNADFKMDNLPANRSDITLSYEIASTKGAAWANNLIKVYVNDKILTKSVTTEITSPNEYVRIIIEIPDGGGVKSLRFSVDGQSNDGGMRLDNVRIEGKPSTAKTK